MFCDAMYVMQLFLIVSNMQVLFKIKNIVFSYLSIF